MICKFCNSIRKNQKSLIAHEATCPSNPDGYRNKPWNKGLTKNDDPRIKAYADEAVGRKLSPDRCGIHHPFYKKPFGYSLNGHSEESKKNLSKKAKERKLGGYIKGSGRGKKGWYKGFFCDSSWELAFVIYYLDHDLNIERNLEKRTYVYNGKIKNYIPDFITDEGVVELKGYKTDEWIAKFKANPDIIVYYQEEMKEILNYVITTYGKKFIDLYE